MKKLLGMVCVVVLLAGVWLTFQQKDENNANASTGPGSVSGEGNVADSAKSAEAAQNAGSNENSSAASKDGQGSLTSGTIRPATLNAILAALEAAKTEPDQTQRQTNVGDPTEDSTPRIDATLEGCVVNAITGEPVTEFECGEIWGAYSYMVQSSVSTRSFQKVQNAEGCFVVKNISRSFTFVVVRAPGYEPYFIELGNIQPDERFSQVEVRLNPVPVVFGLVMNSEGSPVDGAAIVLGAVFRQSEGVAGRAKAFSDVKGEFQLDIAPTGARVSAYKEGYAVGSGIITDDGGETRTVTITLNSGGGVEGVVTRSGVPQAGERVSMKQSNFTWAQTVTDEHGAYRFSRVPLGDAELRALGIVRQTMVEVGRITMVDFESATDTGTIEGKVTYRGKAPKQAFVTIIAGDGDAIRSTRTRVDADGSYQTLDVPVGPCVVKISARGDAALSNAMKLFDVEVEEGGVTRQDADFTGGATVSGVVSGKRYYAVDSVVVLPGEIEIPNPVTLNDYRGFERITVGNHNLDEGGKFSFEGLEPGLYTVVGCSFFEESPEAFETAHIGLEVVELTGDQETVLEIVME
jgi:hypothetical protein